MGKRGLVFVASFALIALFGCATHQRTDGVARSTESDVRPSALPTDLVGTWSGSFVPIGAGAGGGNAVGSITIAIKDDGTYTATERRRASTWSYSGAGVAKGRTVTLRSSSGTWVSLTHRGDTLYGVPHDRTGYTLQVLVEKESGAPASSPSAQGRRE